jgi:hypothetical protein
MPRYYHDVSHHRQLRARRRFFKYLLFFLLLFGLISGLLLNDVRKHTELALAPSDSTTQTTATYISPFEFHRTQYFQFQAHKSWAYIVNESTANKFVFRSVRNTLVEHELTVFVGGNQEMPAVGHIIPVQLEDDRTLEPSDVLEHCSAAVINGNRQPHNVVMEGITFYCNPDSPAMHTIAAAFPNGTTTLRLGRPDGTMTSYSILYRNLTALPDKSTFSRILDTFQTL